MENIMFEDVITFIKDTYKKDGSIHLHEPIFIGNEKKYLNDCIDTTFVSSVGKYVTQFEEMISAFSGVNYAVATANGTSALHIALEIVGVDEYCEVITQPLTFVATANAISYCRAKPVFVDVDRDTLGLSPLKLKEFLDKFASLNNNGDCVNQSSGKVIKACVPMHTFGNPCKIDEIVEICNVYNIAVVEDAAEALGSYYKRQHTGSFGKVGIFSFNGNKIITTGAGGMLVTNDEKLALKARHLTTTAKVAHPYEYVHDQIGYNYRLTNIAAAIGVAQMENIELFLKQKRKLARAYETFFEQTGIEYVKEPANCQSNFWLNSIVLNDRKIRDDFLGYAIQKGILARPIWTLMNRLDMFKHCQIGSLQNAEWLGDRVINIPSSSLLEL